MVSKQVQLDNFLRASVEKVELEIDYSILEELTGIKKIKINFELDYPITLILGDSGTGKTFMCNVIKQAQDNEGLVLRGRDTLNRIVVIDKGQDLDRINQYENKIIICDRADRYSESDLNRIVNKINSQKKRDTNRYIIIARYPKMAYDWDFNQVKRVNILKSLDKIVTISLE